VWFALAPLTRCYIKIYSSGFTAAAEKKAGTKTPGSAGGRTRSVRKICHKEPRDQGDHGKCGPQHRLHERAGARREGLGAAGAVHVGGAGVEDAAVSGAG